MVELLRHRQTKGAATDMFYLTPPRHISTLPSLCENSDVELARRISVSISSLSNPITPATSLGRKQLRKQFCASLAQASFHTAWVNRVALTVCRALPFSPGERTSQARGLRSEKCQIQPLSTLGGASLDDARLRTVKYFTSLRCRRV